MTLLSILFTAALRIASQTISSYFLGNFFGTDFNAPPREITASCFYEDDDDSGIPQCPRPSLSEDQYTFIYPGGRTSCLKNETKDGEPNPYFFQVKLGRGDDANNLLLYLQGGGLCFSVEGCARNAPFAPHQSPDPQNGGMFNIDRRKNPFKDWAIVIINYCSGDGHIGNATSSDGTIEWRGRENVAAALAWAQQNYPDPDRMFLTGCSAGSIGAQYWADIVLDMFPNAIRSVLYDSFVGEFFQYYTFSRAYSQNWQACDRQVLPRMTAETEEDCRNNEYSLQASQLDIQAKHRDVVFGFVSHKRDFVGVPLFCVLDWPCDQPDHYEEMKQTILSYTLVGDQSSENNVVSYFINDVGHCILERDDTYYRVGQGYGTFSLNPLHTFLDIALITYNAYFWGKLTGTDLVSWTRDLAYRDPTKTIVRSQCFSRFNFLSSDDFGCDATLKSATFTPS